jgi:hypothetical protein
MVTVTRAGYTGSISSAPTAVVQPADPDALTGTVTITGTAKVGETLTADITALAGTGTVAYRWLRDGAVIPGATAATYVLTEADAGKTISVSVSRAGYSGAVASAATAAVEALPAGPAVTGVSVTPADLDWEQGESPITFTATVTVTGGAAQTVTWSVSGGGLGTSISAEGVLTIGAEANGTVLTVTATATADTTKSGTATVTVYDAGSKPTVSSVTVSPATATVERGGTQTFTVAVTGTNAPSQDVTWSIVNGATGTTAINSSSGLLTVAEDQTPGTITVRATSVKDTTKSGDASVTVPGPTVSGVTVNPVGSAVIHRGGTKTFTVTVTGTGYPSQDVTWTITSGATGTTAINSSSGVLTVAEDQAMGTNALTVRATAVDGGGTAYGEVFIHVTVPAPVVTAGATETSVTLSWAAVSGADGYRVRRGDSSSTIGNTPIANPGSGDTSYTDTTVSPNTTYWYEVEAYAGSYGSGSAPVSATTTSGGKSITLNNFPNNATMGIYLSTVNTDKASFQAGVVAGARDDIAFGNKVFHSIKQADPTGLSTVDWTGTGSYYVFIDGSGGGQYFYVSKNPISFASGNTVINFDASEWNHLATGDDWTPTGPSGVLAATLTVTGLDPDALGLYCQAALLEVAGFDINAVFGSEPPNMGQPEGAITTDMVNISIYDNPRQSGTWAATSGGTYMVVLAFGTDSSMVALGYGSITLTGTHGTFDLADLTISVMTDIPDSTDVGALTPSDFGLTYTESGSNTVTDGDGTHTYTHYKLTDTGPTRFFLALAAIEEEFGNDGQDGYLNRYPLAVSYESDFLLLEVIDHPPAGIGGGDEVRLIEYASETVVNGRGWHQ